MFSLMWRQLRGRAGRSVALLLGILVATTGFVVLTGATTTSRPITCRCAVIGCVVLCRGCLGNGELRVAC